MTQTKIICKIYTPKKSRYQLFLLAIMGLLFYLHGKYLHSSTLPTDITRNWPFLMSSKTLKNHPALNGKPGHISLTKLTLLTSYFSGYYHLILISISRNIITNTKNNHQQRDCKRPMLASLGLNWATNFSSSESSMLSPTSIASSMGRPEVDAPRVPPNGVLTSSSKSLIFNIHYIISNKSCHFEIHEIMGIPCSTIMFRRISYYRVILGVHYSWMHRVGPIYYFTPWQDIFNGLSSVQNEDHMQKLCP